jgi:hypothetical protein
MVDESLRIVVEFRTWIMEEVFDSIQPFLIQRLLERSGEWRDGRERLEEIIEWSAATHLKRALFMVEALRSLDYSA